jgi:hypothetical protein
MKITLFVVTYKNDKVLNEMVLKSLHDSKYPHDLVNVKILNNFGDRIEIDDKFKPLINEIHHNTIRLDNSTGHLARDWNHGIMNAFVSLKKPRCDAVILLQNDTIMKEDWYLIAKKCVNEFSYCSFGCGDQCQIVRPDAIARIGMFDERFCNIGFQECDYFIRAVLREKERCSINDPSHGRIFNQRSDLNPIVPTISGFLRRDSHHMESFNFHHVSKSFLIEKWGAPIVPPWGNTKDLARLLLESKAPFRKMWKMYPYFENDIDQNAYLTDNYFHGKSIENEKKRIKLI